MARKKKTVEESTEVVEEETIQSPDSITDVVPSTPPTIISVNTTGDIINVFVRPGDIIYTIDDKKLFRVNASKPERTMIGTVTAYFVLGDLVELVEKPTEKDI